jgi:hypothetical protein
VVLTPRRWRQVGDDARASCRRWWQKSPAHQEEHEGNRKTIAQGMPALPCEPVVTLLVCFFHLRTRLRVRRTRPAFPAPSSCERAVDLQNSGAKTRRGTVEFCLNAATAECARSPACGGRLSHLMVRVSYSSPRERERVVAREDTNEMSVRVGGIKTRPPPRCRSPREKKARAHAKALPQAERWHGKLAENRPMQLAHEYCVTRPQIHRLSCRCH